MQSIKSNPVQKSNNFHPSFQARLVITPAAKKVLEKKISDAYTRSHSGPKIKFLIEFNFNEIFKKYKKAVEEATRSIKGTIKLSMRKGSSHPVLTFKNASNKMFKPNRSQSQLFADNLLPKIFPSAKNLIQHATIQTVAGAGDIVAQSKAIRYGENNPFQAALMPLLTSNQSIV